MSGRKQRCARCNRKFRDDQLTGGLCPTCKEAKTIKQHEEESPIRYALPEERDDYVYFS